VYGAFSPTLYHSHTHTHTHKHKHKHSPQTIIKPRTRAVNRIYITTFLSLFRPIVCYPDVTATHQTRHMFPVRPHTDKMETLGKNAFQSYGQHKYVKLLFIFVSSVQTLISNLWGTGHTRSMPGCCRYVSFARSQFNVSWGYLTRTSPGVNKGDE